MIEPVKRLLRLLPVLLSALYSITSSPASADSLASAEDPVLVGAGDIAACTVGAEETAQLLDKIDGTVFTAGDNAYENGTSANYRDCYEPTWGRHKERTRPSPGNHDYMALGAAPYFSYFGENAGPTGLGYYSYDLGTWHILSLNSNIDAGEESVQAQWLRSDLAAHAAPCTLAYWHHPVFSSGDHGNDPHMRAIWRVLFEYHADVVINGHDHDYERFAPQTPDGQADLAHGIREFVVGTGGQTLRPLFKIRANSEVRNSETWGVLKLTLHETWYDWEFIPVEGKAFRDSGHASCVLDQPSPGS
jgi:Calcineurin-like phosphoesterase